MGLALVAVAIVLVAVTVRNGVAAPSESDRVEIAHGEAAFPGVDVQLWLYEGSALARPDSKTGVGAAAEVRFPSFQDQGSVQIRVREPGSAYGILAFAPDLKGARRVTIEGGFPPVAFRSAITYEVWLHIETANGVFDTEPVIVEIQGVAGGERAILR